MEITEQNCQIKLNPNHFSELDRFQNRMSLSFHMYNA